jgi:transcriptional antiterminator RfaH
LATVSTPSISGSTQDFGDSDYWYVIHCQSGKEKSTSESLRINLGLSIYVPEEKVWRKGNAHFMPWFPGYFFIQADLQRMAPSQINTSPGVLRLLECEGVAQEVPAALVETLRTEVDRLNEYRSVPNQGLRPGDIVYMMAGPFRGLESVFVGPLTPSKRVQVLLNFLGRSTKVEVEVTALEKRTENVSPQLIRTTRGKGRQVRHPEMA